MTADRHPADCLCPGCDPAFWAGVKADEAAAGGPPEDHPAGCQCGDAVCADLLRVAAAKGDGHADALRGELRKARMLGAA